jgi:hypothetical protein
MSTDSKIVKVPVFDCRTNSWGEKELPPEEIIRLEQAHIDRETKLKAEAYIALRRQEYEALGWPPALEPLLDYLTSRPNEDPNTILKSMVQKRTEIKQRYPKGEV